MFSCLGPSLQLPLALTLFILLQISKCALLSLQTPPLCSVLLFSLPFIWHMVALQFLLSSLPSQQLYCFYPFVAFTTKNYQSFLPVFLPVLVVRNNILVIFAVLVSSLKQEPFNYSLNGMNACNTEIDQLSVYAFVFLEVYMYVCVYVPSILFVFEAGSLTVLKVID